MEHYFDYPLAPFDAVMPAQAQSIMLGLVVAALIVTVLVGMRLALTHRSWLPICMIVGGFLCAFMEPLITNLGHVIHPEIGQLVAFKTADRAIPLHIVLIYPVYFCAAFFPMYSRITGQGFTRAYVWRAYLITCALAYLLEIVPVSIGLWVYYDQQALWVWESGMPLFWTFVNACCVLVPVTLLKVFGPVLHGPRVLLAIPLIPAGGFMGHFGAGFLYYNIVNSPAAPWLVNLAGLASVLIAFLLVWLCSLMLERDTRVLFEATR